MTCLSILCLTLRRHSLTLAATNSQTQSWERHWRGIPAAVWHRRRSFRTTPNWRCLRAYATTSEHVPSSTHLVPGFPCFSLSVCFLHFFSRLPALEMQVLGLYCFNDTAFPVLRVRSIKMKTPKATGGGLDMSLQTSFNLGLLSQVKVSDVAKRY